MKKKFTVELMYGDADGYSTHEIIMDDPDEIEFFTHFLNIYQKMFHEWQRIYKWDIATKKKYVPDIEKLRYYLDPEGTAFDENTDSEYLSDWVDETFLLDCINGYFNEELFQGDYTGQVSSYTIEDLPDDVIEMSRTEAENLIQEKLGMHVSISAYRF